MLPYILLALPLLLMIRAGVYTARKKRGFTINWYHELGMAGFILFLVGLASQTLIPVWGLSFESRSYVVPLQYRVNLIPFQSLSIIGRVIGQGGFPEAELFQLLGNIGMFAVPGFMFPLLWKKFEGWKQTVSVCFLMSLAIEIIQLFSGRSTDVDDLMLNTLGGLLGFLFYIGFKKTKKADVLERFKTGFFRQPGFRNGP